MKRFITVFIGSAILSGYLFAGGILTNGNQSAKYIGMMARDATIDIDAVYYNPAGLTFLEDGLHISLNNQMLWQTRLIESEYMFLSPMRKEYEGKVSSMIFPGIYAVYKTGKLAISGGFNPTGGGGSATYENGLPSFEYGPSNLVPGINAVQPALGVTGYQMDVNFEGSSVFFGTQLNVSYRINDMISVSLGGRYVMAKETYKGYLRNIQVNPGGVYMPANTLFNTFGDQATAGATAASGAATNMQPLVDAAGGLTFAEAEAGLIINAETRGQLEGGLTALGIDPSGLTLAQAQAAYSGAATSLTQSAVTSYATANLLVDQEADVVKTGSGLCPIIGVDIKVNDKLNIALKYEHITKLKLTNDTKSDVQVGYTVLGADSTMFPDDEEKSLDIPALLTAGITFKPNEKLLISGAFHMYFDQMADWEGREELLDGNSMEIGLGLEYALTNEMTASAGYLRTTSPITEEYQKDISFHVPGNTVGIGLSYKIMPELRIDLGCSYTRYDQRIKYFTNSTTLLDVKESYNKDILIVAIGVNYSFLK